jgi:integration host factor subunit beta
MATLIKKSTMTKKKLINSISQEKGIHPNDVRHVIQAFLDKMTDSLSEGDRLEFRDFGVFEVVERKQKIGRNPKKAAEPIVIPARNAVKFTPGKKMRKRIEIKERHAPKRDAKERDLAHSL